MPYLSTVPGIYTECWIVAAMNGIKGAVSQNGYAKVYFLHIIVFGALSRMVKVQGAYDKTFLI